MPAHRPAAQPAALRQVVPRRHPDLPAVLRARRLRLRRDAHQRRQPAGVQGADARPAAEETRQATHHHHRADPRPARGEGPRGGHGAVLRRLPRGEAVPDHQRQPADARTHPEPDRPGPLRRHHQMHPVRVLHDELPGLLDARAATSVRPPSSTPTGSSSTAATRPPPSGWTSSTRSTACGGAAPRSTAPSPARAASRSPRPSRRSNAR